MGKKKAVSAASKIQVTEDAPAEGGQNVSAMIRAAIAAAPADGPKEVAETVSKQLGREITAQYVSTIKSQDKKKAGGKGPSKKVKSLAKKLGRGAESVPAEFITALDAVMSATDLLRKAGGAEQAKAIIDRLAMGSSNHG